MNIRNKDSTNNTNCVQIFHSGENAWKNDWYSVFLNKKGLIISITLSILFAGSTPWWYPDKFPQKIHLFSIIIILLLLTPCVLYYLRKRTMRSLKIKSILHEFAHSVRDFHSNLFDTLFKHKKIINEDKFFRYLENIISIIYRYFLEITSDNTIGVALRLAIENKNNTNGTKDNIYYKTFVRIGLNKKREETSEAISANEGLPRFLIEKHNKCKVIIYKDLKLAIENNLFKETENEKKYSDDITTMMVAPLNAWDGKRKNKMIGILYITSKKENTFKEKDIDSMKFIADKLADTLSITIGLLKLINNKNGGKSYVLE